MTRREDGFTLIELMVVVLIIAILIAVAVPTYLGFRERAFDVAAKEAVHNTLKAAKGIFADFDSYSPVSPAELKATEPSVSYVDGATSSSGPDLVSVHVPDSFTFLSSVYSRSGTCFFIRDNLAGTQYATLNTGTADCHAGNATVSFTNSWP